jgi:transcriptional regulatory protein LevR
MDYENIDDKINKKFAFYNTQLNHVSELQGMDMMERKDIDFSDFEAIQANLQKEGDKEEYSKQQKQNKMKASLLAAICIDP